MPDLSHLQLAVAGGVVLVVGLAIGVLLGAATGRRKRRRGADVADWKLRMAARDHDLAATMDRLAEAELELQSLREQRTAGPTPDLESEAKIAELTEELTQADEELIRLRSLGVDKSPAASSTMARRLEALEVELSTMASMLCPDPSAHRQIRGETRTNAPHEGDDLTLISGVGPGLAEVMREMGYRTFRDIAALEREDLEEITRRAGTSVAPATRDSWVASARRLADAG